jgi:hypothetical protein
MQPEPTYRPAASAAVGVLTFGWLAAVVVLCGRGVLVDMERWTAGNNGELPDELVLASWQTALWLTGILGGGPLLIAAVALVGRLRGAAATFLVIGLLLSLPFLLMLHRGAPRRDRADPQTTTFERVWTESEPFGSG